VIRPAQVGRIDATGLPLGMFHDERFEVSRLGLLPGETLLLYTDGVVETQDGSGDEYGRDRLSAVASASRVLTLPALVDACVKDVSVFRSAPKRDDDVTVMAIRRSGADG
jgi:sigma-B regulation protein RsbU (phosphoserine phosphatase)